MSEAGSNASTGFQDHLKTRFQRPIDCYAKRLDNVVWIKKLDRLGLSFETNEKEVVILTTQSGEEISIRYPGKEISIGNEWDFRPKLAKKEGTLLEDMTFKTIWDIFFEQAKPAIERIPSLAGMLAALFYRMAFMLDHAKTLEPLLERSVARNDPGSVMKRDFPVWLYRPPMGVVGLISEMVPAWGNDGISFEAFLHYNDLLAWNEDCKYYFRDTKGDTTPWDKNSRIGRINNILTHINIIGLITGKVRLTRLLGDLSRTGVAPVSNRVLKEVCPLITNNSDVPSSRLEDYEKTG